MYTECPSCKTFFKITPSQLKAASGKVRCGNCNEVFSALDGLVDVVPEDAINAKDETVSQANATQAATASEVFSELDMDSVAVATEVAEADDALNISQVVESEVVEQVDSISEKENLSDLLVSQPAEQNSESVSFADVEIPGMNEDQSDVELALESAIVSKVETVTEEERSTSEREELNQDIDAALDGLFDENTEVPGVSEEKAVSDEKSDLSTISELDELQNLDFGDLEQPEASSEKEELESAESIALPKSESITEEDSANKILESETSSLSEFERELGQISDTKPAKKKDTALDESSFDLGESFLDSDLSSESATDSKPESELYNGDSFILEELEEEKSSSSGMLAKIAWIFVISILLVVLLGEFVYLKRQTLASYPQLKPVIENLCSNLNKIVPCEITAARDVSAIEILERNVVSHPNAKNALLITSTIENTADFDQPFPDLILTFSDINQKIIARRKFTPAEYLSKDVDIEAGMKKNVPIKLMLEIVDPGEEAVNFEFNFQ